MGNCLTRMKSPCCTDDSALEHLPPENRTSDIATTLPERFNVHSEDDLKSLLEYIDQAVEDRRSSTTTNEASETITSSTSVAAKILDKVKTSYNAAVKSNVAQVAHQILCATLEAAGKLHWVAAGLSIVALILNQIDMEEANLKQCLDYLEALRDVGRHVISLYAHLPDNDVTLRKATSLIAEGAIICCTHLASGSLKRFALAGMNNSNLAELKERINNLYPILSLAGQAALLRENTLPLRPTIAQNPANAVGLDNKISEVLEMLGVESGGKLKPGIQAVDSHGIGGIGKSTLGDAVHAKLPFEGRSHVKVVVGEDSSDDRILTLQKQILERLHRKVNISHWTEGRQIMFEYLKTRKEPCLFFVDNIFNPDDLEKLLPEKLNEVLPDRSRIIVTSRPHSGSISRVLSKKGVQCQQYDVPELDRHHAQSLLCKEIFSSTTFPPEKEEKFTRILKLCGGLPLALQVVGGYLGERKDDDTAWDLAFENLGNFSPVDGTDKLTRALEFGYNALGPSYRKAFLDVACLLRDLPWYMVKSCTRELGDLEKWGLVKRSQANKEEDEEVGIVVHDLLVALAQRKQRDERPSGFRENADQWSGSRLLVKNTTELPFPLRDDDDESLCALLEGVCIINCGVPISAK